MAKNKLQRFAENEEFSNVFQPGLNEVMDDSFPLKGKWNKDYFKNEHPVVVELGCGKGEYTVGLAEKYPKKNFIGIDIKGARLWNGANQAINKNLDNVAFIRMRVDFIKSCFAQNEVSEIWITFPDPQPQKPRERKRLTSPRFLNRYREILKKEGIIHLKTDNRYFYEYTLEVIKENDLPLHYHTNDLYKGQQKEELTSIQTHYETVFLKQQIPICYIRFGAGDKVLDESKSRAIEVVQYYALGRAKYKT